MYAKVFRSLWDGSLRGDSDAQIVFIYLLAHCDEDGVVEVIRDKIADDLGWRDDSDRLGDALDTLEKPDQHSRNPEDEGRRIEPLDEHRNWGWRILNYKLYRDIRNRVERKRQNREAQQRRRQQASASVSKRQPRSAKSAKAEAEVEAEAEALERGLSSSLKLSPTPDGGDYDPRKQIAGLVVALASDKKLKAPRKDWRPAVWEDAKAIAKTSEQAHEFMQVAGWLRKQGIQDEIAIQRVFRAIVEHGIRNPMAYFTRHGQAINAITGQRAVERAEQETREIRQAEERFLADA